MATQNGAIVQLQAGKRILWNPNSRRKNTQHIFLLSGKLKWIRDESLADIAAIQMVDLPLADNEGVIEKQLKNAHGKLIPTNLKTLYFSIIVVKIQK